MTKNISTWQEQQKYLERHFSKVGLRVSDSENHGATFFAECGAQHYGTHGTSTFQGHGTHSDWQGAIRTLFNEITTWGYPIECNGYNFTINQDTLKVTCIGESTQHTKTHSPEPNPQN